WQNPERWQDLGKRGQEYVQQNYMNRAAFAATLERAVNDLRIPLIDRMRSRGLARARRFTRQSWRDDFSRIVEQILHVGKRPARDSVSVRPRGRSKTASAESGSILVPVRVSNRGDHALACAGPARTVLCCRVLSSNDNEQHLGANTATLPSV